MHGSYIGLVVGFVVSYFMLVSLSVVGDFYSVRPSIYVLIFTPIILGFFVGWGIHSWFRTVRDD